LKFSPLKNKNKPPSPQPKASENTTGTGGTADAAPGANNSQIKKASLRTAGLFSTKQLICFN
jgi:hypothetical protein